MKALWMISRKHLVPRAMVTMRPLTAAIMVGAIGFAQLFPSSAFANSQSISSAQQQAAAAAAQLNSLGAQAARSLENYDNAQATLSKVDQDIKTTQAQILQTQGQIASLKSLLTVTAISSYMNDESLTDLYLLLNENPTQASVREEFLNTTTSSQADLVASHQAALQSLQLQQNSLKQLQKQSIDALTKMTAAKNAALTAIGQEKSQLSSIDSNLAKLVAQEQAAQGQSSGSGSGSITANDPLNPSSPPADSGVYANPLRAIRSLARERIDQGVDYRGYGPIYAIGTGVVLSTYNGGWPGGTYITYRLTQGPAAGLAVYAAEDIKPLVQVGQTVTSSTIIGTVYEGFDGIETGWADPNESGETMARYAGQFGGSNSTMYGYNFSQLLRSLDAPQGVLQNQPTGTLPSQWPTW